MGWNLQDTRPGLFVKGFTQAEGLDFNENYSPMVTHCSIRILLSMVANNTMELEQIDIKTSFLHGDLEEIIYMSQRDGFVKTVEQYKVCLLKKSLYGLKQSPRKWYLRFHEYIERVKFSRSNFDSCVYIRQNKGELDAYMVLYVDHILIASKSKELIQEIKGALDSEFEMKDLGEDK